MYADPQCTLCLTCNRPVMSWDTLPYDEFCEFCYHRVRPQLDQRDYAKLQERKLKMIANYDSMRLA